MQPNPIRGEVKATLDSLELVLAIDMDGLARLSAASGHPTLPELYRRLHGTEPMTVMLALEMFTLRGTVDGRELGREEAVSQAKRRLTLDHMMELQGPLAALMAALLSKRKDTPPGNAGSGQSG